MCGLLGPWQYGKLNTAYAWQPIWAVFGSLLGGFVVLAFAAVSGYSFIEVRYRGGTSIVVSGVLWGGDSGWPSIRCPNYLYHPMGHAKRNGAFGGG